ncbi:histidine--tRNA ligase, chloroplastic/mitochondrial isoform X1 [Cryptomeria japonica]|uniref:histidine--tRNA ligase, chloroplastic/mitochondrial isoform X1 n=2 Tax=Cryptomeria japonica TaxID=3369 RepID=UPI0025AC9337|nr:histidine--tRNA ligase, chloroplastic/mitochondrial isoform X1 [Cryptomeria japonica]
MESLQILEGRQTQTRTKQQDKGNIKATPTVPVIQMGKIPLEEIEKELAKVGIPSDAVGGILQALSLSSFELEELLGSGGGGVSELKQLFSFANEYGYADWIEFDASVVRGLAYYTGTVFEGFDRDGKLRAVCGGGRYDWLLSTFSGEDIPACGFGFDDAVIVELLREKKLIPVLTQKIDDIVFPLDKELRQAAAMVASSLRSKGNVVDLILEDRRLKWAFKHAERVNAKRMFLVGDAEWKRGAVRVKNLATREESDILINDLE